MRMLKRLPGLLAFFMLTAQAGTPPNVHAKANLVRLADAFEKAVYEQYPEKGMLWGKEVALNRFADYSLKAHLAWQRQEDTFLEALKQLNEADLQGSTEHITYQLLKQTLEANQAFRVCRAELWHIDPLAGWHNLLAMVAEKQPIGTPYYRAQALQRWRTFPQVVEAEIRNLQIGLKKGYSAPKVAVHRVLKQINIIIDTPIEKSPYFDFARRDNNKHFKKEMAVLIRRKINPALKRYAIYLQNEYLPVAREKIGVSSLPSGNQCYAASVYKQSTLHISPEKIQALGYQHMQQLNAEISKIGTRQFGLQEVQAIFKQAHEPRYLFHTEQEILEYNQAALERAKHKVSDWFDLIPKSEGVLKSYPLHRAKTGALGEYFPPSADGKQPGIFYINTYEPEKRSRIDQEAILFHELIPGHHFQIALVYEDTSQHSLNRYLWNAGFGEGWALYVERLADEMGLYCDDISRLGMLSNEALRTARLVVDPGIHVMGWSREQAIDYLKQHTALDSNIIEGEVDRYIMHPGQATSYMLGKLEIENLRQLSQKTLDKKFDIKLYHNQVLKNGTVTLPMLRAQITHWLEAFTES